MPESTPARFQVRDIVTGLPDAHLSKDAEWTKEQKLRTRINNIKENILVEDIGPDGTKREPTLGSIDANVRIIIGNLEQLSEHTAEQALQMWDKLGVAAVEKFGADPESNNKQAEGLLQAKKIDKRHEDVQALRQELASKIIDHQQEPSYTNVDRNVSGSAHKFNQIVDVRWEDYADKVGIAHNAVNPKLLKSAPAFQEYRDALVARIIELDQSGNINLKDDLKSPKKFLGKIWSKINLTSKIGLVGEARQNLNLDLAMARKLSTAQSDLSKLASLNEAREYMRQRGEFLQVAGLSIEDQQIKELMPAISSQIKPGQEAKLKEISEAANIEAYTQIEKDELRANRIEAVRVGRAEQARILQEQATAQAKERAARLELNDLAITARNFSETSEKQRQITVKALVAIAEKNSADRATSEFAAKIAEGKLPQELENLVHGDVGAEVDLFIKSSGKKGNIQSVQTFFKDLGLLATRADQVEDGLPTTFMPLNTIENETIDPSTGETTKRRSVETGLLVGLSEDGSWELRLSTRENGKINAEKIGPVLRLEPENILVSIKNVLDQQNAVEEAQNLVREFEAATKFKGGTNEGREQTKRKLASANKSLSAYQAALMAAKGELASQLSTTGADRTFGGENGVFAEITKRQTQIAEQIFNEDFIESVKQLSVELNVPASEVTVDALASLSASAEHGSIVASDMAEYFDKMSNPGQLQAEVLFKHEEDIKDMAERFAILQKDEAGAEGITSETAREAAKKDLRKQRKELEKSATLFGEIINNAFIAAIPEALREGSRSIPMTKTEFNKAVNYALKNTGFNPKDFGAVAAKGPNKGMTTAQVVRTGFSFDAEVMQMADAATDALRVMRNSEAAQTLLSAIDGGDIDGFLKEANAILEKTAAEKLSAIQLEEDRAKLAELLRTPDGMARLIYDNEINWDEALPLLDEGSLKPEELEKSLLSLEEGELRDKAIKEAARRMQSNVMRFVNEKGFLPPEEGHDDALNGNPSLAAEARFAAKYASPDARPLLESFANRLAMEKKTNPSA